MSVTVIEELVTKLGINVDEKTNANLKKYADGVKQVAGLSALVATAVLGAGAAVFAFAQKANAASADLKRFSDLSGISAQTLQEFGYAAEQAGGSFEGIQGDLKNLIDSVSSPMPGQFNQGLFMLGVASRKASGELKSADELLLDVADRMKGMSAAKQARWASEIGLGPDALLLIKQGRAAIEAYRKEAQDIPTVVSDEDLANAQGFMTAVAAIRRAIAGLAQTVAAGLGPVMKEISREFIRFMKANGSWMKSGIVSFMRGIAKGFSNLFWALRRVSDMFHGLFDPLKGLLPHWINWEKVIEWLTTTGLVLLTTLLAALAAKFVLIGVTMLPVLRKMVTTFIAANAVALVWAAAILFAALALEDLWTYMQGGDSVIGSMIKDMGAFGTIIEWIVKGVAFIIDGLVMAAKTAGVLAGALTTMDFSGVGDALEEIGSPKNSIMAGRRAAAGGGQTVNQTFNINSADPMGAAGEVGRKAATGFHGGQLGAQGGF